MPCRRARKEDSQKREVDEQQHGNSIEKILIVVSNIDTQLHKVGHRVEGFRNEVHIIDKFRHKVVIVVIFPVP